MFASLAELLSDALWSDLVKWFGWSILDYETACRLRREADALGIRGIV